MTIHTVAGGPTPALMKEINAAFNSRDVDRIMTFFADDATRAAPRRRLNRRRTGSS